VVVQPDERHANRAASVLEWYEKYPEGAEKIVGGLPTPYFYAYGQLQIFLDNSASDPSQRVIYGSYFVELLSRSWDVARLFGFCAVSPRPNPSDGVG